MRDQALCEGKAHRLEDTSVQVRSSQTHLNLLVTMTRFTLAVPGLRTLTGPGCDCRC
jgi:hypothetical protein